MQDKKINFTAVVHDRKEIPKLECVQAKNAPYVKYGELNDFPDYLFDLYNHSSQFLAIVENMVKYICGNGIESGFPKEVVNRKGMTFDELIEKIIYDYIIFGGFAIQLIRNKIGEIAELNYIDFRYVRVNAEEDKIFYSNEWKKGRRQPKVYDKYVYGVNEPNTIFYYKGRRTRDVYPVPMYLAALTALEISTQIPEYNLNCLENDFLPGGIINFCNGSNLSEDVMNEIEDAIKEKFTGTKNASKILISFNDDTEHATTFERLADDGNVDIYNTLKDNVEKDIYTAFRCSKLLMGDGSDSTGFQKVTYIEAFALYNKVVIEPIQREIEKVINNILGEGSLHFEKFVVDWSETGPDEDTSKIIE